MPSITCDGKAIYLAGTSFFDRGKTSDVPGAHWDKTNRRWTYPATPLSAVQVSESFPEAARDSVTNELIGEWHRTVDAYGFLTGEIEPIEIPEAKLPLWNHQRRAVSFALCSRAFYAALDMGCGKTAVAIHTAMRSGAKRILITCPLTVVPVWPNEFKKHTGEPVTVVPLHHGSVKDKKKRAVDALAAARENDKVAIIINHESLWREPFGEWATKQQWDIVIADELHRGKSAGGRFSMYLSKLGKSAKKRIGLSGTPIPHSPLDAYGQFRFLDQAIFGTNYTRFRSKYAVMGGFGNYQVVGWQNRDEYKRRYDLICYSVKSGDVQDLPETQHISIPVELSKAEMDLYRQLNRELVAEVQAGTVTVANALTKLLRLSQITGGNVGTDQKELQQVGTSKRDVLDDFVESVPADESIVVFTRFVADIDAVKVVAKNHERRCYEITGHAKELESWLSEIEACKVASGRAMPIIAVNIQSGGLGIDLTASHIVVYFSLGYSLGDYTQSLKRTHRPGQTRRVLYYHLLASGTVDDEIMRALENKQDVIEAMIGNRR